MKIVFNSTTRVIRGTFTHNEEPLSGEGERTITTAEETTIANLRTSGAVILVDDLTNGIRAATIDEADERKTFRAQLLDRIKLMANLVNRAEAYKSAPAVLLAMENGDKPGAKAVVDTLTTFSQTVRDRLKALIDLAP